MIVCEMVCGMVKGSTVCGMIKAAIVCGKVKFAIVLECQLLVLLVESKKEKFLTWYSTCIYVKTFRLAIHLPNNQNPHKPTN